MESVLTVVAAKAVIATLLAVVAALGARFVRRPSVVHALWLVVLLELIGPPLLGVGVLPARSDASQPARSSSASLDAAEIPWTPAPAALAALDAERGTPDADRSRGADRKLRRAVEKCSGPVLRDPHDDGRGGSDETRGLDAIGGARSSGGRVAARSSHSRASSTTTQSALAMPEGRASDDASELSLASELEALDVTRHSELGALDTPHTNDRRRQHEPRGFALPPAEGERTDADGQAGAIPLLRGADVLFLRRYAAQGLAIAWICGALFVLGLAAHRWRRFRRQIVEVPEQGAVLRARARNLAARMGLERCPELKIVRNRIAPMVGWRAGRVEMLFPEALMSRLSESEREALIAHELAHVKRHDHLVRFVELAAASAFWWHPVSWWARRGLRRAEERACDEHVLETLPGLGRSYARAMIETVEFLSGSGAERTPMLVSGLDEFTNLKERLTMILDNPASTRPSRLQRWALAAGAAALVLSFPTWAERASNRVHQEPDAAAVAVAETPAARSAAPRASTAPVAATSRAPRAATAPQAQSAPLAAGAPEGALAPSSASAPRAETIAPVAPRAWAAPRAETVPTPGAAPSARVAPGAVAATAPRAAIAPRAESAPIGAGPSTATAPVAVSVPGAAARPGRAPTPAAISVPGAVSVPGAAAGTGAAATPGAALAPAARSGSASTWAAPTLAPGLTRPGTAPVAPPSGTSRTPGAATAAGASTEDDEDDAEAEEEDEGEGEGEGADDDDVDVTAAESEDDELAARTDEEAREKAAAREDAKTGTRQRGSQSAYQDALRNLRSRRAELERQLMQLRNMQADLERKLALQGQMTAEESDAVREALDRARDADEALRSAKSVEDREKAQRELAEAREHLRREGYEAHERAERELAEAREQGEREEAQGQIEREHGLVEMEELAKREDEQAREMGKRSLAAAREMAERKWSEAKKRNDRQGAEDARKQVLAIERAMAEQEREMAEQDRGHAEQQAHDEREFVEQHEQALRELKAAVARLEHEMAAAGPQSPRAAQLRRELDALRRAMAEQKSVRSGTMMRAELDRELAELHRLLALQEKNRKKGDDDRAVRELRERLRELESLTPDEGDVE